MNFGIEAKVTTYIQIKVIIGQFKLLVEITI